MDVSFFISSRLKSKKGLVVGCITVSFVVMIIAVAVASGFRREISSSLSQLGGDIAITPPSLNVLDESFPIEENPSYLPDLMALDCVKDVVPAVYKAGMVKSGDLLHGVLFKGIPMENPDSVSFPVSIPSRLGELLGLSQGDEMPAYFIGDRLKIRKFRIVSLYDDLVRTDDKLLVYAPLQDIRRLNGWDEGQVSALEVILDDGYKSVKSLDDAAYGIGMLVSDYSATSDHPVIATSSARRYPVLFDWLQVIDLNVLVILILMTIVAGFNMISGLLIMLFENISTIGLLKSMGMKTTAIARIFLYKGSVMVFKGMLLGNVIALLICFLQEKTHILRLNPENYFVSFVPMNVDLSVILLSDIVSYLVIVLLLLLPCIFISRVDPSESVRVK